MNAFDSVFADQIDQDSEFDTIFGSHEDGELIDIACGFNEAGECETDFDELHQTADDADPDDIEDEVVGDETKNTNKDAEGRDPEPAVDLAAEDCDGTKCPVFSNIHQTDDNAKPKDFDDDLVGGETDNTNKDAEGRDPKPAIDLSARNETADKEFSANGFDRDSEADDFYPDDIRDDEPISAQPGEGPDVNMDDRHIEDDYDKYIKEETNDLLDKLLEGESDLTGGEYEDDGLTDGAETSDECKECKESKVYKSMDYRIAHLLESEDEDVAYENGDSDLVDLVISGKTKKD